MMTCLPQRSPATAPHAPVRPPQAWRLRATLAILCLAGLPLAGCAFPGPLSESQRDALASCRSDADRVYNAQNRYQLSERSSIDSPFSGGTQPDTPSDQLSNQYSHDEMVSDCLKRSNAVPVTGDTP
jgi:hypothetical protein